MNNLKWFSFAALGNSIRNWGREGTSLYAVTRDSSHEAQTAWMLAAIIDELATLNGMLERDNHPISTGQEVCLRCWQTHDLPALQSSLTAYGADQHIARRLEKICAQYYPGIVMTVRDINPHWLRNDAKLLRTRNRIQRKLNAQRKARKQQST